MDVIDAYLEHLRRRECSAATIRDRRKLLSRLHRELPYGIGETSTEELAAWLYRPGWKRNSKATYYAGIRSFYTWATDPKDPWMDLDPSADLEVVHSVRGVPRPVTDEQLRRILTEAAQPIRLWATIAAYQGLRCCEISRLNREDITEDNVIVVKGKGGRPRAHDTDPYVWAAVRDLPRGPIARTPDGRRATADQVSSWSIRHFRESLGLRVGLHQLRHWLGVTVQREYRDIRVTQKVLGHVSLTSTQVYTDATDHQQREARATLPRLAG